MTIAPQLKSDADIRIAVHSELKTTLRLRAVGIVVDVVGGAVSLSGEVESYSGRMAATEVASRVPGVRAVVDDLVVSPTASDPIPAVTGPRRGRHVALTADEESPFEPQSARRVGERLDSVENRIGLVPLTQDEGTEGTDGADEAHVAVATVGIDEAAGNDSTEATDATDLAATTDGNDGGVRTMESMESVDPMDLMEPTEPMDMMELLKGRPAGTVTKVDEPPAI